MPKARDLTGCKIGRWTVVKRVESKKLKSGEVMIQWLCKCECGTERVVAANPLNAARSLSCGCRVREHMSSLGLAHRLPSGQADRNAILSDYKTNAVVRGHEWGLTDDEFNSLTTSNCYYCDAPPSQTRVQTRLHGRYTYTGIDRVDNNKGYKPGNVVPCCKICNYMKRKMTQQEFLAHLKRILSHRGKEA